MYFSSCVRESIIYDHIDKIRRILRGIIKVIERVKDVHFCL
jgi:hypothetical protein